jgi:phage-related protein
MKPFEWVGSSYKDFRAVQDIMGFALYQTQFGSKRASAKPLSGFGGAGVIEIVEDHQGNAYRAVYTVKFDTAVYVLHAFQKKSKKGIKTPLEDIELVRRRMRIAEQDHAARTQAL